MDKPLRDDFRPSRNETCFCNSGLRFKSCCGSSASNRRPPYGVVVIENFLSPDECQALVVLAKTLESERLTIVDLEHTNEDEVVRKVDEGRVTERVDMSAHQSRLDQFVKQALLEVVEPHIKDKVSWFEQPQLLKYNPGGFYLPHADSENFDESSQRWRKDLDRDISLLLYLNSDFEGGHISFENFGYKIKPTAGMLIFFPSDSRYLHTAEAVTEGVRYAIVSWSSLLSSPKVRRSPPPDAISLI